MTVMDNNNWRPAQVKDESEVHIGDWRTQLQSESRQRIVNKIIDTLNKHRPFSGQEQRQQLEKVAIRFEEKMYAAATSQSDYLRKISVQMIMMEPKKQNSTANIASNGKNSTDSVMDANNWRPAQRPVIENSDWRSQLQNGSRQRIVNKIMDTLNAHPPFSSGREGQQQLENMARRFEEKMYTACTSQTDYLRKISLKMLGVDSKSHNSIANYLPSNFATNNKNAKDAVMDNINWSPAQVKAKPATSTADWRTQLQNEARQIIVNKIMETLKRLFPFPGDQGSQEAKGFARRFEEKIYSAALSQTDYLRTISLKMLTMNLEPRNLLAKSLASNYASNTKKRSVADAGFGDLNQPKQLSVPKLEGTFF